MGNTEGAGLGLFGIGIPTGSIGAMNERRVDCVFPVFECNIRGALLGWIYFVGGVGGGAMYHVIKK